MRIISIITLCICLLTLTGCGSEEKEDVNKKVNEEISYLDSKIVDMINNLNNLSIPSYTITSQEVKLSSESSDSGSGGESSSSGDSSGQGSQETSSGSSSQEGGEEKVSVTEITKQNILGSEKEPDWDKLKTDIEELYSSWNTISIDLYSIGIKAEEIQNFSKLLDLSAIVIKNKNKTDSLKNLSELYKNVSTYSSYIPENEIQTEIFNTKYYVVKAYELVEEESWDEMVAQLSLANDSFLKVAGDEDYKSENEVEVNKVYTQLGELDNTITTKDKDVFFIKYVNFIKEIDNLNI